MLIYNRNAHVKPIANLFTSNFTDLKSLESNPLTPTQLNRHKHFFFFNVIIHNS